jgi:hypothetical protein
MFLFRCSVLQPFQIETNYLGEYHHIWRWIYYTNTGMELGVADATLQAAYFWADGQHLRRLDRRAILSVTKSNNSARGAPAIPLVLIDEFRNVR